MKPKDVIEFFDRLAAANPDPRGELQFICHLPGHEQYGMVGTLDIR